MRPIIKSISSMLLLLIPISLTSCGGGGGGGGGGGSLPTPYYEIGGVITGLTGSGLVLRNNNADNLAISANGSFTFSVRVASSSAQFSVTVLTHPSNPRQVCDVINGSGNAAQNITTVSVVCGLSAQRFAYVTNAVDNTISSFIVNATTGQPQGGRSFVAGRW